MYPIKMARWLSWLERRPVTAEVVGSSPIRVVLEVPAEAVTSMKNGCIGSHISRRIEDSSGNNLR